MYVSEICDKEFLCRFPSDQKSEKQVKNSHFFNKRHFGIRFPKIENYIFQKKMI